MESVCSVNLTAIHTNADAGVASLESTVMSVIRLLIVLMAVPARQDIPVAKCAHVLLVPLVAGELKTHAGFIVRLIC